MTNKHDSSKPSSMYDVSQPMKTVIDGKVYSTIGSMLVHELVKEQVPPFGHTEATQLYKNRLGRWFLVLRNEVYSNDSNGDLDLRDRVIPLEQEDAITWMEHHCSNKLLELMEVPEAGDPGATVSLRMPKELKIKLTTIAIQEGISLNAWCIEALKRSLPD